MGGEDVLRLSGRRGGERGKKVGEGVEVKGRRWVREGEKGWVKGRGGKEGGGKRRGRGKLEHER